MKQKNSTQNIESEQDTAENESMCMPISVEMVPKNTGTASLKVKMNDTQHKNEPITLEIRNSSAYAKIRLSKESAIKLSDELAEHTR